MSSGVILFTAGLCGLGIVVGLLGGVFASLWEKTFGNGDKKAS